MSEERIREMTTEEVVVELAAARKCLEKLDELRAMTIKDIVSMQQALKQIEDVQ